MKLNKTFFRSSRTRKPNHAISLIAATLCLAAGMIAPATALSGELAGAASTEIALNQLPDHGMLPDAGREALDEQKLESLAEEASKQAQTEYLAEKWRQHPRTVRKYVNLAWAEAEKRDGVDPELIIAIMQKESSLRPKVQSRYGAQGLMQVVRRWHREKLHPSESLFDPAVNVRVGAEILEEYLELAGGSLSKALTKYSGNARGYAKTVLKESRKLAAVANKASAGVVASRG